MSCEKYCECSTFQQKKEKKKKKSNTQKNSQHIF